jgi:hypothetical protein
MRKTAVLRELARGFACVALAFMTGPLAHLSAQETLTPLTPAGRLRFGISPVFSSWDTRFGGDGSEPLGADLTDPTGARLFPGILTLQDRLHELLQEPSYLAWLGGSRAEVSASQVRVPFQAELGVFGWLSLGVTVPLVQNRTEVEFAFRADSATANLGLSPAVSRPAEVLAFSDELGQRLGAATARADAICGPSPASPECASARQLAQDGQRLVSGLRSSYAASPFFPLETSAVAGLLRQQLTNFNQGLVAQGLAPVSRDPLFAEARLSAAELDRLLLDPDAAILAAPPSNRVNDWALGDVEVHATLRLLQSSAPTTPDEPAGFSYLLGAGALVRLGTGEMDDPNLTLDLPAGDGQTDIEGRVFANLRAGSAGLWSEARYGIQQSRTITRRVGPPDLVFVPLANLTDVEWAPGDYFEVYMAPRGYLSDGLAGFASYRLFHKQQDTFTRLLPAPPAPDTTSPLPAPLVFDDVDVLADGTEQTIHEVGAGLLYSTLMANAQGRARIPLEGNLEVRWVVAGRGRSAPGGVRARAGVRLFIRFWGD